ncbi:hypothetical protein [Pedosphaera parvula]|uniref:Lipoprotein n=1 Tax=Pedosphaera parvula (strain Ellin514) TaxID=320771 RepID=B9XLZ4_PEDPL|nr:hypothetical protein [Pedosphaera parvula]EEF59122.1 hypothetical protein Cflav_PD1614 [Pedosphaera parvula Ellin514]
MMKSKFEIYLAVGLISVTFLVGGCDHASSSTDSKTQWIDPNKLEAGPVRHASLTEAQMERVKRVQKVFSEVEPSPIEQWVDDFKRDQNPERELSIWEGMARAYETFTTSRNLALAGKQEVFQVVLLRSGAAEDEVLKHLKLKILTEKDAREIMALFTTKPEPIRVVSP